MTIIGIIVALVCVANHNVGGAIVALAVGILVDLLLGGDSD